MTIAGWTLLPYTGEANTTAAQPQVGVGKRAVSTAIPPLTPAQCLCRYAMNTAAAQAFTETIPTPAFVLRLTKNIVNIPIVPGSVSFTWSGHRYVDRQGAVMRDPSASTGIGPVAGSIDYLRAEVKLDVYDGGDNTISVQSMAGRLGSQFVAICEFRLPGAPIRPGSFSVVAVTRNGDRVSASANFDGKIEAKGISGLIDTTIGFVSLGFGELVDDSPVFADEEWYNPNLVNETTGKVWKPIPVYADSLEYVAVAYSYIPLNPDLLGLNPVRLPSDGRVPIVKPGDIVVVHHTATMPIGSSLPGPDAVFTLPRQADVVEIYDSADPPLRVPKTQFTHKRGTDKITFAAILDLAAFTAPLVAMHRVEDMILVATTQINGQIGLGRPLTRSFPVAGSFVSSSLRFGDLQARYYGLFDQKTWGNVFSNDLIGDAATGTYNEIDYPILVKNSGAVKERWALVFTDTTHFNIIAEKRGVIGTGYTSQDCQPLNTATGLPYFFIDARGWGTGWAAGNAVRFNTEGASAPVWIVRSTMQGPVSEPEDHFTVQIRGDAE